MDDEEYYEKMRNRNLNRSSFLPKKNSYSNKLQGKSAAETGKNVASTGAGKINSAENEEIKSAQNEEKKSIYKNDEKIKNTQSDFKKWSITQGREDAEMLYEREHEDY